MNASGMETLDNVCGLFETAIQLESRDHREVLFRLASELMETQNLLDWIEKTRRNRNCLSLRRAEAAVTTAPPGGRLCRSLCSGCARFTP